MLAKDHHALLRDFPVYWLYNAVQGSCRDWLETVSSLYDWAIINVLLGYYLSTVVFAEYWLGIK